MAEQRGFVEVRQFAGRKAALLLIFEPTESGNQIRILLLIVSYDRTSFGQLLSLNTTMAPDRIEAHLQSLAEQGIPYDREHDSIVLEWPEAEAQYIGMVALSFGAAKLVFEAGVVATEMPEGMELVFGEECEVLPSVAFGEKPSKVVM